MNRSLHTKAVAEGEVPDPSLEGNAQALLQRIYEVGEQMQDAVEKDDWGALVPLARKRAALAQTLQATTAPPEDDPAWETRAEALAEQHRALMESLSDLKGEVARALAQTRRQTEARERYHHASEDTPEVLHDGLHG